MSLRLINLVIENFVEIPSEVGVDCPGEPRRRAWGRCTASSESRSGLLLHQAHPQPVHALIESGFVTVEGNECGGRGASRRYRINVEKLTPNAHLQVSDKSPNTHPQGRVSKDKHSPLGESKSAKPSPPGTNTLTSRLEEPLLTNYTPSCKRQQQRHTSTSTPEADPDFLRFWTAYPKKRGKQDAYRVRLGPCIRTVTADRIAQQVSRRR